MTTNATTIEQVRALVGRELGVGGWFEVTQERVNAFAEVTGDHQWIHVDTERAAASPFGGTIAHGLFTLSVFALLQKEWEGARIDLPIKMSINYGLNKVRFIAPVRIGKRIRLRTKLAEVAEVAPNTYHLITENTVEIEGEAKPAMVSEGIRRVIL